MTLEQESPAELYPICKHNLAIIPLGLLIDLDQAALKRAVRALPVFDGAVGAAWALTVVHFSLGIAGLEAPGAFTEAGEFVGFRGEEILGADG